MAITIYICLPNLIKIGQKNGNFSNSRWRTDAILKMVFGLYLGTILADQCEIALSTYLSRELSDIDQIWYTDTHFHSEHADLTKIRNLSNSRWRTDAILKMVFGLYLGTILADQCEIRNRNEGSHAYIGHVTKTAIFANSRWRTAAILKIALSTYLSRELSDFDQIWYTDTNFHSEHADLTKKNEIFQIEDGERTPY